MFEKDNTVFKHYGNNKLMAIKLWSMDGQEGRITKFKFEFRTFDKSRQQGDKTTGSVDVYMDIEKFSYLCELLRTGRMWGLLANAGGKPAFKHYAGTSDSKSIEISSGDKGMLVTASEGPGIKGNNGQTIPDYKSWNQSNSRKISVVFTDEIAVEVGIAGMRAISYLDGWTIAGTAEANLARINPAREQMSGYQNAQPGQGINAPQVNNGYAAQGQGGYVQPQHGQNGYGQGGYNQGYAAQSYNGMAF